MYCMAVRNRIVKQREMEREINRLNNEKETKEKARKKHDVQGRLTELGWTGLSEDIKPTPAMAEAFQVLAEKGVGH